MQSALFYILLVAQAALGSAERTAVALTQVMEFTKEHPVAFKDRGILHGYYSTQSCLHSSSEVAVFKNYCFPVREYPARSFTLVSFKYGVVRFYEEQMDSLVKRDVHIESFPEDFSQVVSSPMDGWKVAEWNPILEKLDQKNFPGCWSTNYSNYTQGPEAGCFRENISSFAPWASETQALVHDEAKWNELFAGLESLLVR